MIPVHLKTQTFKLENYSLLKISGNDAENFLNGQLTNNFTQVKNGSPGSGVRLDLKGHIQFSFFTAYHQDSFLFLIQSDQLDSFVRELDKFIIMEDVSIEQLDEEVILTIGPEALFLSKAEPLFYFMNIPARLAKTARPEGTAEDLQLISFLTAFPKHGIHFSEKSFLNETLHNIFSIDYKKGCFFGQELVSKLETGRGGSYFPVYYIFDENPSVNVGDEIRNESRKLGEVFDSQEIDGSFYILGSLFRDFRVDGKLINLKIGEKNYKAKIKYAPLIDYRSSESLSEDLYLNGVKLNNQNQPNLALELLELSTRINPKNEDAIEAYGVLLENTGRRDQAIEVFKELLELNPLSVMAHTNLSLIYMRAGRIEEAEEEKAQATVKGFQLAGKQSKDKKAIKEEERKKLAELERKKGMFEKVLEIDENDTLALYGLGDYYFQTKDFDQAISFLKQVIEQDSKYSVAYQLLGKSYQEKKDFQKALEVFEKGIEVAANKGDLMPANDMQNRLNTIRRNIDS